MFVALAKEATMNIELSFALLIAVSFATIPVVRWVFCIPAAASRAQPVYWEDLA